MICLHCETEYKDRVGRGLCRSCWDDETIRINYPPKILRRPPLTIIEGESSGDMLERWWEQNIFTEAK